MDVGKRINQIERGIVITECLLWAGIVGSIVAVFAWLIVLPVIRLLWCFGVL